MEIKYMKKLRDFPVHYPGEDFEARNEGMSEQEINDLEEQVRSTYYQNLSPKNCRFPAAFRELLFLAGDYCYVLDVAADTIWNQDARIKQKLSETLASNTFLRPFFVIETYESSFFIYLDENKNDPDLYIMDFDWDDNAQPQRSLMPIVKHTKSLTELVNHRITSYLEDRN